MSTDVKASLVKGIKYLQDNVIDPEFIKAHENLQSHGPRHVPMSHATILNAFRGKCEQMGLMLFNEQGALSRCGERYMYVAEVMPEVANTTNDYHLAVGFRSFNDESSVFQMSCGARVMNLDCSGNVVLTLKGNNVIGCEDRFFNYAGLGVNGASYNGNQYYTLVIDGDGSLVVSGGYDWPGIGSCVQSCGNIEIRGGHITAIGDGTAPGIGAGKNYTCRNITITGGTVIAKGGNLTGSSNGGAGIGTAGAGNQICGNILITGGTVEATGGYYGAGIGTAYLGRCGTITITDGVTQVTATKGGRASKSIGLARKAAQPSCGTVTIGGVTGSITESPYYYPPLP